MSDRLGAVLADRYRIERELGHGGMATVYLAEDVKHHRKVAVKILQPELAAALGSERFLREIETTANLRHPHILPLYDSGEAGGFLYYVMPSVGGESLRDRLTREKQLPLDDALAIAREVADALGYAHARGVVHRDIKPENILLENGHAVVADFGIARAVREAGGERLTLTGMAVGTPTYMSPEQAAGASDVDGRSDLYSLGCVLYEMLGGQAPFTGPTADVVTRQHILNEAAPITNLRPTVPAEVASAIARTLAKNPADRFSPAAQFSQAITARSATHGAAPSRGVRRNALLGAALGVAAVATIGWLASTRGDRPGAPSGAIERLAVLPMDNQTGDTSQAFFADGMTREVIGVLSDVGVRGLGHRAVVVDRAAPRAIALDDRLGDAYIARGLLHAAGDWDFAAADRECSLGMARNPSTQAQALYSWILWETGRHEEAVAVIRKVIEVEPTTAQWHSDLGWLIWSLADSAAARAAVMRAIPLDSTFYEPYHLLTVLEVQAGNVTAARAAIAKARVMAGGDFWTRQIHEGRISLAAGDTASAGAVLKSLDGDSRFAQRAWLARELGDVDASYALLNQAIAARDVDALWLVNATPTLYRFHGEPRYQQLLKRMGITRSRAE